MTDKKPSKSPLRFLGLGFQMVAYVGICAFIGYKLDEWLQTEKPWFTLTFSLAGAVLAMVYLVKQTSKM